MIASPPRTPELVRGDGSGCHLVWCLGGRVIRGLGWVSQNISGLVVRGVGWVWGLEYRMPPNECVTTPNARAPGSPGIVPNCNPSSQINRCSTEVHTGRN